MSKKIFSGVQPTGNLHLGNYLGAIKNFVNLQNNPKNFCIYCVVDLHAITVKQDPFELKKNIRETAAAFIASGLDYKKSIIFNQSLVPAHSEGSWLLSCVARMGWLNRMTQFKEKAGKNRENVSSGLYTYPNLMAADILLYFSDLVPVGDDQKQHLELTRDIAQKFNNDYSDFGGKDFFPIPNPIIMDESSRVMSLRDGTKKMSKSDPSAMSRIEFKDSNDLIVKKISKAKTDPLPIPNNVNDLETRPEVHNLISIFSSLAGLKITTVLNDYSGKQFSEFKKDLSDLLIENIEPIRDELIRLDNDHSFLLDILEKGTNEAMKRSSLNMKKIRDIVGLGY